MNGRKTRRAAVMQCPAQPSPAPTLGDSTHALCTPHTSRRRRAIPPDMTGMAEIFSIFAEVDSNAGHWMRGWRHGIGTRVTWRCSSSRNNRNIADFISHTPVCSPSNWMQIQHGTCLFAQADLSTASVSGLLSVISIPQLYGVIRPSAYRRLTISPSC